MSTLTTSSLESPVLILGAGLMGRLLGVSLARQGHRVEMVDAGSEQGDTSAARVAAAMLAPLAESAITETPVVAMGQYSTARWKELLAELQQEVFFQQSGTLILWHRQDAPEAQRFSGMLAQTVKRLPTLPAPQSLDSAAIARLEPDLQQRFHQGLYLPDEGQLDNRQLLAALLVELDALGINVRWETPMSIAEARTWQAEHGGWVLDCRGLGSQGQWQKPSENLRGVRGEVVRLHAPDVHLSRPTRLLHPRYPIYIAPKPGGIFVIGATEIETQDLSPASVRSTLELLSAAYAVHPGFGEGRILELCSQCRPTLPDNLPAVIEAGPQMLQINGLYRHGFLIAPAIHDCVLEWMHSHSDALAQRLGLRTSLSA